LALCVAFYRVRFDAWPTQARFTAPYLWDIAHLLGPQGLERLADLMDIRTTRSAIDASGISVGGSEGVQHYEDVDHDRLSSQSFDEAKRWLGVEPADPTP
jgi:hypothetical protein